MTALFLALLLFYQPEQWMHFPAMDSVQSISAGPDRLYVAVPNGVYIFDRNTYQPVRTLTEADGLSGPVRLCAYSPVRGDLFVATDGGLYQYLPQLDQLARLYPPFRRIRSIGIASDGAWFDTEQGMFRKQRLLDRYEALPGPPDDVIWHGERDERRPDDYVFLVPYYLTDSQLNNHRMTVVQRDARRRLLYVAADGYGIAAYSTSLGIAQRHIRLGPTSDWVRRIIAMDDKLWFSGAEWTVTLNRAGQWTYLRTRIGDLPVPGSPLLSGRLLDLERREQVNAVLPESGVIWLGTGSALYSLGTRGKLTRILNFGHPVNGLARLGDSLLIGTDFGLYVFLRDSLFELRDPFDRTGFGVYSVARPADGSLWLGTLGGILHLDASGLWQHIIPPGFDLSRPVRGLTAYQDIVFFDNGSGITGFRLPASRDTVSGSFFTIDSASGLPDDRITALHADSLYLWVAAPGIISRFSYRTLVR